MSVLDEEVIDVNHKTAISARMRSRIRRLTPSFQRRSPSYFLATVVVAIFCAETFIMFLFLVLPKLPDLVEAFLDSTLLSLLIAPALYRFLYQPLVYENMQRSHLEQELRQSQIYLYQRTQQLEETLKKLQQAPQLVQTEKMSSLGRLVAGIAHEINNPINFIYGNVGYVNEYTQALLTVVNAYQRHYPDPQPEIVRLEQEHDLGFIAIDLPKILSSMKIGTDRIRQIVLSLRNFSRLDEADVKLANIPEGIDSTLLLLQHRLKAKSGSYIQIVKHYDDVPMVECYPGQLNQVFMNILSNAIDALEEGAVTRKLQSEPTVWLHICTLNQTWLQIRIRDNGIGMNKQVKERIFEPLFTTKPVGAGTGLGLAISYQIISEKHRGHLRCISELNQGSEFVIEIPLQLGIRS